jgi:hypothetical protein
VGVDGAESASVVSQTNRSHRSGRSRSHSRSRKERRSSSAESRGSGDSRSHRRCAFHSFFQLEKNESSLNASTRHRHRSRHNSDNESDVSRVSESSRGSRRRRRHRSRDSSGSESDHHSTHSHRSRRHRSVDHVIQLIFCVKIMQILCKFQQAARQSGLDLRTGRLAGPVEGDPATTRPGCVHGQHDRFIRRPAGHGAEGHHHARAI